MNLTAIDFFGKVVWTGGSDQERADRLRAYEATGMEPEEIVEMKQVQIKPVDAVEVVRCKDCEFAKIEDGFPRLRCCAIYNAAFPANGFCNLGVKKNDET